MTGSQPEFWLQIHYQCGKKHYKYNLPLPSGQKILEGVTVDFARRKVAGGYRLIIDLLPAEDIQISSFVLTGCLESTGIQGVMVNGYQSWTESYERLPEERFPGLKWPGKLLGFHRFGDSDFHSYSERRGRFHGYGYAYLRYPEHLILIGSMDESAGYTVIGTDIRQNLFTLAKDLTGLRMATSTKVLDAALLEGREDEVFDAYRNMRGVSIPPAKRAFGWISIAPWGRRPDELNIRRNLAAFRDKSIPLDYFIIGEGWQSAIGVWNLPNPNFPSGMSSLSAEIRGSGYLPGIWYAPFVVGVDSAIFRTRKDWLVPTGRVIKPAGNRDRINGDYFALNVSRSDVRTYIEESYRRITEKWRYEILALDLLYAAGRQPVDGLSRGAALHKAMDFLYSLKGNEKWLVNGTPLDACFGKAEYIGVSSETDLRWERNFQWNIHFRERRSVRNAVRTLVSRRQLDGRFGLMAPAPICLNSHKMDDRQHYTQMLLSVLFGNFITTSQCLMESSPVDTHLSMSLFSSGKPEILSVAEKQRLLTVHYRYADRQYVCFSNLAWRARHTVLPTGQWFCANHSAREAVRWKGGAGIHLEPGETRNFLLEEDGNDFDPEAILLFSGLE